MNTKSTSDLEKDSESDPLSLTRQFTYEGPDEDYVINMNYPLEETCFILDPGFFNVGSNIFTNIKMESYYIMKPNLINSEKKLICKL